MSCCAIAVAPSSHVASRSFHVACNLCGEITKKLERQAFSPVGRMSKVGREKKGTGRQQLGRDLYPMPFTVGLSRYSATNGELVGCRTVPPQVSYNLVQDRQIANSDERRQDAWCIVSCGCPDELYLGLI